MHGMLTVASAGGAAVTGSGSRPRLGKFPLARSQNDRALTS